MNSASTCKRALNCCASGLGVVNPVLGVPARHPSFQRMLETARDLGIPCALTTVPGLIDLSADPLGLGTLQRRKPRTAATLAGKLGGWYTTLTHAIRGQRHAESQALTSRAN